MVRGIDKLKNKKRMPAIKRDIEDANYISSACLQGGKAIGEIVKHKKRKK